jgi:hypothetical protein
MSAATQQMHQPFLVYDTYSRLDTVVGLDAPERDYIGQGYQPFPGCAATYHVVGGQVRYAAGVGVPPFGVYVETGNPNVTVQMTMPVIGPQWGMVCRFIDSTHFVYCEIRLGLWVVALFNGVAGVLIPGTQTAANGDVTSLEMSGSLYTLRVNGAVVGQAVDAGAVVNAGTKHGFGGITAVQSALVRCSQFSVN